MSTSWISRQIKPLSKAHIEQAKQRQAQLTKPARSLGTLEDIAVRLAGMQYSGQPSVDKVRISVFAADHGIAATAGVSAFPQSVTVEMIKNFVNGGAAISVMADHLGAGLEVVDVGSAGDPGELDGVVRERIAPGTADFRKNPAMTAKEFALALRAGKEAVERAIADGCQLFICGEMGIGNTTAASALCAVLLGMAPEEIVGPGTGVTVDGIRTKQKVIEEAIAHHSQFFSTNPMETLRRVGGLEIAAMCGAYIACGQKGLPCIVDGFIASSAVLVALFTRPKVSDWLFFGHRSMEPGHTRILNVIQKTSILNLDMALGEGTGAAAAVPILRLACDLHNNMATFAEAEVSSQGMAGRAK